MKVSVKWCLEHSQKAYRIHYFQGTFTQFCTVISKADELGIEYTCDITEYLINSIINP